MSERWIPKHGELYYYISTTRTVIPENFNKYDAGIIARCFFGNCFRTAVEAESAAKKFKAFLLSFYEDQPVTNSNQLPKLTAEVFDRPDCPEWAQYAAVDVQGLAYWYQYSPLADERIGVWKWETKRQLIDGFFDRSDWQNSLVERPAKLPDWCKVGEWIYTSSEQYLKINGISIDLQKIELSNGATWSKQDIIDEAVPARLRPYNAEEMKALVGKVTKDTQGSISFITGYCAHKEVVYSGTTNFTAECLLISCCFLDNTPCGVLEHLENGEWVK